MLVVLAVLVVLLFVVLAVLVLLVALGHNSFVCKFGHIILFAYLYLPTDKNNICTKHTTYDT